MLNVTTSRAGSKPWFMAIATVTAMTALAAGSAAAWSVSPSDVAFTNQQGVDLTAKLFKPAGAGPFPAVVMMHGCSGAYSYSNPAKGAASLYRRWGDSLVAQGYVAILVDSFSGRGGPQKQCGNGNAGVSEVSDRPFDAAAAYNFLIDQSYVQGGKVGLLGWSHGGSSVLATMDQTTTQGDQPFKVGVAFYPGCGLYNAFGGIGGSTWVPSAPLAIHHGTVDPLFTSGYCQTRIARAEALAAPYPISMTAHNGAKHSFDNARSGSLKWTADDLAAKTNADAAALATFAQYLQ